LADIFHEVDEEVRRDQLKKLWERHGGLAIALAVLIVIGVGGWRGYEYWQAKQAAQAGAAFEQALSLSEEGKHQEAEAAFAKVATQSSSGYRVLARLSAAAELAQRDSKAAVAEYDKIAAESSLDAKLKDLAALRAGFLLVDSAPLDEMTRRLEPLAGPDGPYRHSARELLALSAWRAGDMAAARRWSEQIMGDADTPASLRSRIEMLMALTGPTGKG
jgi:hypothetical protein